MQSKDGASDDTERSERTRNELWQIITSDVFHDFAATAGKRAIRKGDGDANDEVAERAKAET
jgi:hypothetical protein